MKAPHAYRGQPLVALVAILGGWVVVRTLMWDAGEAGWPAITERPALIAAASVKPAPALPMARHDAVSIDARRETPPEPLLTSGTMAGSMAGSIVGPTPRPTSLPLVSLGAPPLAEAPEAMPVPLRVSPMPHPMPVHAVSAQGVPSLPHEKPLLIVPVAAQHLLWLRAMTRLPLPPEIAGYASAVSQARPMAPMQPRRWSGDGWLLLRDGKGTAGAGFTPPSYGASQVGAVIRYRLAPENAHRLALYLRATAALGSVRDQQAAGGLSARPVAKLPVTVAAEVRAVRQTGGGTRLRPAAFAVTELPEQQIGGGMRLEAYAQAGYVGGRDATAFADGQVRIDREIADWREFRLRGGAAAWGGAQKGAGRIDVGPSVTIGAPSVNARLGLDWRLRVAGQANPRSGPALTLSAGF